MSLKPLSSPRRYDLDWLRVLAILTVFVFHCGRFLFGMKLCTTAKTPLTAS